MNCILTFWEHSSITVNTQGEEAWGLSCMLIFAGKKGMMGSRSHADVHKLFSIILSSFVPVLIEISSRTYADVIQMR